MVDKKPIAVVGAAIVLITIVTIFASSYMSDFDNARSSTEDKFPKGEFESFNFKHITPLGSKSSPITIVKIGDYQCEMCKSWFDNTRPAIIENYINTGKVNLIFVDFPFLGNDSMTAAQATYCAYDQGRYSDYHETLYQYQQHVDDGWASSDRLSAFAFGLDLDVEQFDQCLNSKKYFSHVNFNKDLSQNDFGVTSTPTFLLVNVYGDYNVLRGAHTYESFEKMIEELS